MDLTNVLTFKYPGAEFLLIGNEYSGLDWHDKKVDKPTLEDIEIAAQEYEEFKLKNAYKQLRRSAYPSIEDQLDLLYKEGIDSWRDTILAIKNKYPKDEGVIEKKPENAQGARIMQIENELKEIAKSLKVSQDDKQDVKAIVSDVNSALSAINGFLMMIPDIQKSLLEIKDSIKQK